MGLGLNIRVFHFIFSTCINSGVLSSTSLEGNIFGDSGATALADALRVNQSLTTLK